MNEQFSRGSWQYSDMEAMLEYLQRRWSEVDVALASWSGASIVYDSAKASLHTMVTSSLPTLQASAVNGAAGVSIDYAAWWDLANDLEKSLSSIESGMGRNSASAMFDDAAKNLGDNAKKVADSVGTGLPWVALALVALAVIAVTVRF